MKKTKTVNKPLLYSLFILYLLLLIWVVIFKCGYPKEILGNGFTWNPMKFGEQIEIYMKLPFLDRLIYDFKMQQDASKIVIDFCLNLVVFLPLGIMTPILCDKHKFAYTALSTGIITLTFELFQLFTKFGCFSFFDLLANVSGGLIGYLIYLLLMKVIKKESIAQTINMTCVFSLIIFIPILIFAIYYTSIRFDAVIFRFSHI